MLAFAGLLLGPFSIAAAVWVFFAQKDRPSLALVLKAETPLMAPGVNDFENLSVSVRSADKRISTPINDLWLSNFRLINDGNTTVRAADFDSPVRLNPPEASRSNRYRGQVLEIHVGQSEPPYLTPSITVEAIEGGRRAVTIQGVLLNPGDAISFSVLSSEQMSHTEIEARVARIKKISRIVAFD